MDNNQLDVFLDDTFTDYPPSPAICSVLGDFWHNRFLNALGAYTNFADLYANILAILHCELNVIYFLI